MTEAKVDMVVTALKLIENEIKYLESGKKIDISISKGGSLNQGYPLGIIIGEEYLSKEIEERNFGSEL